MVQLTCNEKVLSIEKGQDTLSSYDIEFNNKHFIQVLSATSEKFSQGLIDINDMSYGYQQAFPFKSIALKKITKITKITQNLFLNGPSDETKLDQIDGVVKLRLLFKSVEEAVYSENGPSVAYLRQDYLNPYHSDLILIGGKSLNFYKIKTNSLFFNTGSLSEEAYRSINLTITCKQKDKDAIFKSTVNLNTMIEVSEDRVFNIPSVEAYSGSKYVYLPINSEQMRGNAPIIEVKSTNDDKVYVWIDRINEMYGEYAATQITGVKGVKHIGSNVFLAWSSSQQVMFKCTTGANNLEYKCVKVYKTVDVDTSIRDAIVKDTKIIMIINVPADSRRLDYPEGYTQILTVSLTDSSVISETKVGFASEFAAIKVANSNISIVAVGVRFKENTRSILYTSFAADYGAKPLIFRKIVDLEQHLCPFELHWSQISDLSFYLGSDCDPNTGLDNHLYIFALDNNPSPSLLNKEIVQLEGAQKFEICMQSRLVNIIDRKSVNIFSIAREGIQDSRLVFPLKEYGFDSIQGFGCDTENSLMQVVACKDSNDADKKMLHD